MNWDKLYAMQKELDQYILEHNSLHGKDLLNDKCLALMVELGELANETRCFKFWSQQEKSSHKVILEEYVDGLHFILSIGLELGFTYDDSFESEKESVVGSAYETDYFHKTFEAVTHFMNRKDLATYHHLIHAFLSLGQALGFRAEDIEKAYMEKNEINFQRQDEGY